MAAEDDGCSLQARVGAAYIQLVETDRGILLALMQGFILGHDARIGPVARAGFMRIYDRLRSVLSAEESVQFLAQGMLIASDLTSEIHDSKNVEELSACTLGDKLGPVLEELGRGR